MTNTVSPSVPSLVVMGVQGSGKSTVGRLLAERLGIEFVDGDDLHPAANKQKMAGGTPLTDEDRLPWLTAIGARIAAEREAGRSIVVACSALKRWYRELLRSSEPGLTFVGLDGDPQLLAERLSHRDHEFMPATLLASQFATLEPLAVWEASVIVPVTLAPEEIVERVVSELDARSTSTGAAPADPHPAGPHPADPH